MKCENCKWWKRIFDWGPGQCRNRSPVILLKVIIDQPSQIAGQWPFTEPDDFCGEFSEREPTQEAE